MKMEAPTAGKMEFDDRMEVEEEEVAMGDQQQVEEVIEETMDRESPTIWTITVRSPKLPNGQVAVPTVPESDVANLVGFINEVVGEATAVELEFAKVIFRGKRLDLHGAVKDQLKDGDTVMLLFSSRKEVEALRASEKVDNRIRSIEEEDEIHRKRLALSSPAANSFWGEEQDPTYKFVKIEVCSRFKTPHPFEAEKLLIKLATDPAIKKIMRKYQWTVGTLAEMDPKSDMIARRKQEEEGACVLGYNENAGHKIFLRLRTDDELEFRGYDGLINTLLHELTHNVRGPHDEEFWRVFGQLKAEYLKFHETEYRQGSSKARRVVNAESRVTSEIRSQAGNSALSEYERRAAARTVSASQAQYEPTKPFIPTRLGAENSRARREERERLAKAAEARIAAQAAPVIKPECSQAPSSSHKTVGETKHPCECACQLQTTKPAEIVNKAQPNGKVKSSLTKPEAPPVVEAQKPKASRSVPLNEGAQPLVQPLRVKRTYHEPSPLGFDEENTSNREKRIRQAIIQLCRTGNEASAGLVYRIIRNALTGESKFKTVKTSGERFKTSVDTSGLTLLDSVGFESADGVMVLKRDDPGLLILVRMLLEDSHLVEYDQQA